MTWLNRMQRSLVEPPICYESIGLQQTWSVEMNVSKGCCVDRGWECSNPVDTTTNDRILTSITVLQSLPVFYSYVLRDGSSLEGLCVV